METERRKQEGWIFGDNQTLKFTFLKGQMITKIENIDDIITIVLWNQLESKEVQKKQLYARWWREKNVPSF